MIRKSALISKSPIRAKTSLPDFKGKFSFAIHEISTKGMANIDIKYCHINYIRIINYKEYPPDSAE